MSGSGSWVYPDPTTIIGVKLVLTTPPTAGKNGVLGTNVRYWKGLGRFTLDDEAGPFPAQNLSNDTIVLYNVGHSPHGITYEFGGNAVITATEILGATPGGSVSQDALFVGTTGTNSAPADTLTKITSWGTPTQWGASSTWSMNSTGDITCHVTGLMRATVSGGFGGDGNDPQAEWVLYRNASEDTAMGGYWSQVDANWNIQSTVEESVTSGDVFSMYGYHHNVNPANTFGQWCMTITAT
jgi:hypothetical protein